MSYKEISDRLRQHNIRPSAHRIAVAEYVLQIAADHHPSASQVWHAVQERFPSLSRATVYNTLNLLVSSGLLRRLSLGDGMAAAFDPRLDAHHHFLDEKSGRLYDLPESAVQVTGLDKLTDLQVNSCQVLLRGIKSR